MTDTHSKKLEQLQALVELSGLINSSLEIAEIEKHATEAATRLLDAETGSLLLMDQSTGELYFEVALGEKGTRLKEVRLKKGEGIAGWVAEHNEPLVIDDVANDPRFFKGADKKSEFQTRNMMCYPVRTSDKMLGVLQVINSKSGGFGQEDLAVLESLANQVAIAVTNANLYLELKEAFYGTAQALAETIEKRDTYTGGHTRRVMDLSLDIAKAMELGKREIERLKLSAILHDIGKIGVRDDVLHKEGRLTDEEYAAMNKHPRIGSDILKHLKQLDDVVPGVRGHHEKFDGTGYPDALKGEDIPLNARIIAVADTFDAMTSDRPYRKALKYEIAYEELQKCSGTQFDGEVVESFLKTREERDLQQ